MGQVDKRTADKWFVVGARLRDPIAAYNLGSLYSVNADHVHDLRKAAGYLRQSVDGGYVPAMHALGLLLINHPEVAQPGDDARALLTTAENAGQWRSSIVLAILARDGKGVPADKNAALYHFQIAARRGGDEATRMVKFDLNRLSADLEAGERNAVASAVDTWYGQHGTSQTFVRSTTDKYFPGPIGAETIRAANASDGGPEVTTQGASLESKMPGKFESGGFLN